MTVNLWLPIASGEDNGEPCQVWVGSLCRARVSLTVPPDGSFALSAREGSYSGTTKSNANETTSSDIKLGLCSSFVCRQREVKRAVLSRAANLWPYLLDKSIEVSESIAECAGGATPGPLPPGPPPGGYLPVSSPSISSDWVLPSSNYSLIHTYTHTHTRMQQANICFNTRVLWHLIAPSILWSARGGSALSKMLRCRCIR